MVVEGEENLAQLFSYFFFPSTKQKYNSDKRSKN